ncbi:LytTR family DNA-binding domain-containing protein [Flagellimonas allohymeniacidonis]|uniref:LytTR family transcriptional regulator n=1 Tax=Flagellimonas allohymeniacidonis TaxID=2517819 RepID=A0A4Q8QIE7_9FLAO|nr:LytTR family DNA-binding domain-containing protein [Allomuricauda hymeniacidonis]TAI48473.1 LytTR family transcriptional regulator [Allomuricauda hymeniacidonis]
MTNPLQNHKRSFYLSGNRKKYWYSAFLLGFFVSMILIGLRPYEKSIIDHPHITLVRIGVGFICTVVYIIGYEILLRWFNTVKFNFVKLILFDVFLALISVILIFLYDRLIVVKDGHVTLGFLLEYILIIALPFYPIILFIFHFLKISVFPIRIYPPLKKEYVSKEENVLDIKENTGIVGFSVELKHLLYIQSQDNYIEIHYLKDGNHNKHLMRGTLKKILKDFVFLLKVHRSFVVNPYKVERLEGNSNKAAISFKDVGVSVPVSKSYYASVKNYLSTSTKT